jgi:succinate dehydrogenase / fumarate reductase flavoprotein subunit
MDGETPIVLNTDVLVVGAGGAGMYAALSAAAKGSQVLLVDKNMVGRGGATIMAQMTVAAALAEEAPDTCDDHLRDTLEAGRGLCVEALAALVCNEAPERMREMDAWGVGWARAHGRIRQVMAPGHGVARCCYVDFLNTGPAVAGTLRRRVLRADTVTRLSDVAVVELICQPLDGVPTVVGAVGLAGDGAPVLIHAGAVVIATGGLTKLYERSSASNNMAGEGYALALRAGAELIDMEFVQFFPIGHLAPRLVGMDPIMWDPFRYKLGGRLLNGNNEEFIDRYGGQDAGTYTATRDLATYAIMREVDAGRGTPHGGAYLSFSHLSERDLRNAFGPVIDRLGENGIDLLQQSVEVAPIAHYHMGGIRVDVNMATCVAGLFAAGEAVGGAGGANRLSGNAISEALVFGDIAGRQASVWASVQPSSQGRGVESSATVRDYFRDFGPRTVEANGRFRDPCASACSPSPLSRLKELREMMWRDVGPLRNETSLCAAAEKVDEIQASLEHMTVPLAPHLAGELLDWYELRAATLVAKAVVHAARCRRESRGAHQRDDFPHTLDTMLINQTIKLTDDKLQSNLA